MYQRELEAALEAARRSGKYLLEEYEHFQAIANAPASITTEADRGSQEIVLQHLQAAFPGDALCAEEKTATLAAAAPSGPRLWIVDPIDGTRGFARKNGEFSIMIAFLDRGQLALGVVAQPAAGRLTYALRDGGCWRCDADQDQPQRCRVSQESSLDRATLTQSRSRADQPTRAVRALKPAQVKESYSAGIKLALVARAEADLYLMSYEAVHDWDLAAGHILVTEAGGQVTGTAGQELRYGWPGALQDQGLLASNGFLHDQALQRLQVKSKK